MGAARDGGESIGGIMAANLIRTGRPLGTSTMKYGMVIIVCVLVVASFLVSPTQVTAAGQHGGKAEPKRIQFKRGTSSASVTDSVRGGEEAEYVVEARSGQTIYLEVDAVPKNSVVVSRVAQPGGGAIPFEKQGPGRWTAKLSEDSDYMIAITKEKPHRTKSRYKLIVRIR